METYSILTNRKRAIIALVHSVFFLLVAVGGLLSQPKAGLFYPRGHIFSAANIAIFCVYFIVTSVLLVLTRYSRCFKERSYFAFCSASAGIGLLRALFGDPVAHVGPMARALLLGTAVAIGYSIAMTHSSVNSISES